ncbi:MAG: hypothetical protein KDD42_07540, partial [Bdellovibrionales bacterium]|nr:hypothetical protein [Bdellovibrionales bacterium]
MRHISLMFYNFDSVKVFLRFIYSTWLRLAKQRQSIAITLFCAIFLSVGLAPSISLASPRAKSTHTKALELLLLQADMAASGYKLKAGVTTASTYIAALEKVVGPLCMPYFFRNYSFSGNPTDPECLNYLKALLELDPDNPVGVCIQHGLSSPECSQANQTTLNIFYEFRNDPFRPMPTFASDIEANFKIAKERGKKARSDSYNNLISNQKKIAAEKDPQKRAQLEKHVGLYLKRLMRAHCEPTHLSFETTIQRRSMEHYLNTKDP